MKSPDRKKRIGEAVKGGLKSKAHQLIGGRGGRRF